MTGILMFFEQESLGIITVHQWFSLLFVFGVFSHTAANFKPFKNHLKTVFGRLSVAAISLVLTAYFYSWGLVTGPQLEKPIKHALIKAPLSALAAVTATTPNTLLKYAPAAHGLRETNCRAICPLAKGNRFLQHRYRIK